MPLVEYPDSDADSDSNSAAPTPECPSAPPRHSQSPPSTALKRKRADDPSHPKERSPLPPLPATFHDLYSANARASTTDDPSLHGGRTRAVPHVQGNWPSHVYLEWLPSQTQTTSLLTTIDNVRVAIRCANSHRKKPLPVPDMIPLLLSPLGAPLPLHISLSRTLQLKTEIREVFLGTLTACLRKTSVTPFHVNLATLKWAPNFERNRWFLVLGITKPPRDELNQLLQACNITAEAFGHPGLYSGGKSESPLPMSEPVSREDDMEQFSRTQAQAAASELRLRPDQSDRFHISIAWSLTEPDPQWIALTENMHSITPIEQPIAPFDAVKAKMGNVVHSIVLGLKGPSSLKSSGLLGLH